MWPFRGHRKKYAILLHLTSKSLYLETMDQKLTHLNFDL